MYKQLIFCYLLCVVTTHVLTKFDNQNFLYGSLSSKSSGKL